METASSLGLEGMMNLQDPRAVTWGSLPTLTKLSCSLKMLKTQ